MLSFTNRARPDRDCFTYNDVLLAQDPQSHHSIVEFYIPPEDSPGQWDPLNDEFWQNWICLGGSNAGASCTPGSDECGERGQCATAPETTVACINYENGPGEMGTALGLFGAAKARINLATAQEATFRENYPRNVFSLMPVKGFVVWDSHAFNLTRQDTSVEQWMNLEFATANEKVYPRWQIFDAGDLFGMGRIEAFSSKEVCTTFTIPQRGQLLTLSSHTHRFGKRFRIWYPPNEACDTNDPDCGPPDRELKYCAFYDNGENNPMEVRRESMKPEAETCEFVERFAPFAQVAGFNIFTCGCAPEERSCFGGPEPGKVCDGDDLACGEGGVCDACPVGGGVTTEEEMFLLLGSYYVKTP
jgi:hypothetical protein